MSVYDKSVWDSYKADLDFRRYLEGCRNFDPEGFDRALKEDEDAHSFDFRRVIIAAYLEDSRAGMVR
ncbi:MAG: hypothetical protein HZC22_08045 [Rhodocyclales bacterium]|jgi:hypothetical protein|nr:hypothetical protein [Rhodocyclales bacterium]